MVVWREGDARGERAKLPLSLNRLLMTFHPYRASSIISTVLT